MVTCYPRMCTCTYNISLQHMVAQIKSKLRRKKNLPGPVPAPLYCQHVADVQCRDRCWRSMLQPIDVATWHSMLQLLACRVQNALYCQDCAITTFMHAAMIFIMLPQMFCCPSNFSRCFFLVKFKSLGLAVEPGLMATKLCAEALSRKWRKFSSKSSVVKS